jgi:hypothetical protein
VIGVGVGERVAVPVGVGVVVSVDRAGSCVTVDVLVGGMVLVEVGIAVSVGDFKAAINCGDVVISVTRMVPITPMIAARTVGLESDFFVSRVAKRVMG